MQNKKKKKKKKQKKKNAKYFCIVYIVILYSKPGNKDFSCFHPVNTENTNATVYTLKQVAQRATIAHLSPMCQGQILFQTRTNIN